MKSVRELGHIYLSICDCISGVALALSTFKINFSFFLSHIHACTQVCIQAPPTQRKVKFQFMALNDRKYEVYIKTTHNTSSSLRNYFSLLKTFTRSKSKWEKCTNFLCLSLLLALWIGAFNTDNNKKILGPIRKKLQSMTIAD